MQNKAAEGKFIRALALFIETTALLNHYFRNKVNFRKFSIICGLQQKNDFINFSMRCKLLIALNASTSN